MVLNIKARSVRLGTDAGPGHYMKLGSHTPGYYKSLGRWHHFRCPLGPVLSYTHICICIYIYMYT